MQMLPFLFLANDALVVMKVSNSEKEWHAQGRLSQPFVLNWN